jgi:zinc/manganese transport system ATP-binding protein
VVDVSQEVAPTPEPDDRELVQFNKATMRFGQRTLWDSLTLSVIRGEFLAVLGPNGMGKTTLLRVMLGLQPLSSGAVEVENEAPRHGNPRIGYVPQQRRSDSLASIRGRDLVRFGCDGHRAGLPFFNRDVRRRVDGAIREVGAESFANAPIGTLSGGEQQRLRIAQALVSDPRILLLDEPLLSLDLPGQSQVASLIDRRCRTTGTAAVFVTHEINPILPYVDKVLYLVGGRWAAGSTEDVFTSERLSDLYGIPVEVARVGNRIMVVTAEEGVPYDLMDDEKCRLLSEIESKAHGHR